MPTRIFAFMMSLAIGLSLLAGWQMLAMKRDALAYARASGHNILLLVERELHRDLVVHTQTLQTLNNVVVSPDAREVAGPALGGLLRGHEDSAGELGTIVLTDARGQLLRELHHRVKNNLATVARILSLQRRRTKSPEVRYILAESVNRVQGLAATHDLLSHEDVSEARVDEIARKIVGVANANMRPPETHIIFEVEPCEIVIPSRAVAILALVLNEIVSNAMKHGMKGMSEGKVSIRGYEERGQVVVEVYDTGQGPSGPLEEESSEGLGLSLIRNMIGDLRGQFTLRRTEETPPRTCAEVRFPLEQSSS